MIKTYKSRAAIVVNVLLGGKTNVRVRFAPLSNGSSMYTTTDEALQAALEKHAKYGKLFVLTERIDETEVVETETEAVETTTEEPTEGGLRKVNVQSVAEAKEYLSEQFNVARSTIKSKAAAVAAGEKYGVEFVFANV